MYSGIPVRDVRGVEQRGGAVQPVFPQLPARHRQQVCTAHQHHRKSITHDTNYGNIGIQGVTLWATIFEYIFS